MNYRSLAVALLIATSVAVLLVGSADLAAAADEPWQQAAELMRSGDYSGAIQELDRQLKSHPDDPVLLRIKGACQIETEDYPGAVDSLEKVLQQDPTNVSAKFYLAKAQASLGNAVEAIELLKDVQKSAPDSAYAQKAADVLPDLENLRKARGLLSSGQRAHMSLRTGIEFDDNVPERANGDGGPGPKASASYVQSAALGYRILDEKSDHAPLSIEGSYGYYQNWHWREPLAMYDLTSQGATLALDKTGHIGTKAVDAKLSGGFTYNDLARAFFDREWELDSTVTVQLAPWTTIGPNYSASWKNFADVTDTPSAFSRNGLYQTVGLLETFYTLHSRMIWTLGYDFEWDNTVGSEFKSSSHIVTVSDANMLPHNFRWNVQFQYQSVYYTQFTPTPTRLDNVYEVKTDLSHPIWLDSLRADLVYDHTTAGSSQSFSAHGSHRSGPSWYRPIAALSGPPGRPSNPSWNSWPLAWVIAGRRRLQASRRAITYPANH